MARTAHASYWSHQEQFCWPILTHRYRYEGLYWWSQICIYNDMLPIYNAHKIEHNVESEARRRDMSITPSMYTSTRSWTVYSTYFTSRVNFFLQHDGLLAAQCMWTHRRHSEVDILERTVDSRRVSFYMSKERSTKKSSTCRRRQVSVRLADVVDGALEPLYSLRPWSHRLRSLGMLLSGRVSIN